MAALTTIAAVGSMAIAAGGAAKSFSDASKQQKLQRQAEQDAKIALDKAIRQIKVNPYDELGIFKEPYELQRDAMLAQGAQGIEAGREADRGAAETAGRTYMGQNAAQADIRTNMAKELQNIAELKAGEDINIKNNLAGIDLSNAEGYQKQAKEAKEAAAQMQKQGFEGVGNTVMAGINAFVPLYAKQKGIDPATGDKIPGFKTNRQKRLDSRKAAGVNQFSNDSMTQQEAADATAYNDFNYQLNPFVV